MRPKTLVSVVESPAADDVALTRALSLARWYESDLHVVYVRPSSLVEDSGGDATRDDLGTRIALAAQASGAGGVNIIPAVLSGRCVRAIADYAGRVAADLVVVGKKPRRSHGYWSSGAFATALGKAVTSPTIAIPMRGRESRALPSGISSARSISRTSLYARCPKRSPLHGRAGDTSGFCTYLTASPTRPFIRGRVRFA